MKLKCGIRSYPDSMGRFDCTVFSPIDVQHRTSKLSTTRGVADVTVLAWDNPDFFPLCLAIGASHTRHLLIVSIFVNVLEVPHRYRSKVYGPW